MQHLSPLVGVAGVRALLARSAKLTSKAFPFLSAPGIESADELSICLGAQDSVQAEEAATLLFAIFFSLLTTFIGERLTTQLLGRAWPMLADLPTPEKPK